MKVLIVEDDPSQRAALAAFLKRRGDEVMEVGSVAEVQQDFGPLDVALVDQRLPDGTGLEVLRILKARDPELPVILMTAYATVETAVEAMKNGAFDYLMKPVDLGRLMMLLRRATERREMQEEIRTLRMALQRSQGPELPEIFAESPAMKEILSVVQRVAPTDATVLITGESGTGKEVIARLIHRLSGRKGQFVAVSVAALPETLVEAELFGFEKGAFTGATTSKPGRFELAHQGTLFLDEIGELPPSVQVKLLRVLQEKEVVRLGSDRPRTVDVRIVAATNRDLRALVQQGSFREDLFYRLNVVHLHLPPLRERKEDLIPLAEYFIQKFAREMHKPVKGLAPETRYLLLQYSWPGNIRELENVIERAVVLTRHTHLLPEDLPREIVQPQEDSGSVAVPTLSDVERQHIQHVLWLTHGNLSEAARLLGIHRNTLRAKIRKYRLKVP